MKHNNEMVFVDTSFFKALIDANDDFHTKAIKIWSIYQNENILLLTSNFVLDESFTLTRARCGLSKTLELRELLAQAGQEISIVRVRAEDEANAWNWFVRDWSKLSFTDCVSFAVMKRLDVQKVATFDMDFDRAGFKVAK